MRERISEAIGNQLSISDENPSRLTERGMGLFMRVSRQAPADMLRQGALIAEFSGRRGLNPDQMRERLLADDNAIRKIIAMGNRAHRHKNDVNPLDADTVRRQICQSFDTGTAILRNPGYRHNTLGRPNSR